MDYMQTDNCTRLWEKILYFSEVYIEAFRKNEL